MKIIQFSDTHLMKNDIPVLNINTNLAFKHVINHAYKDLADADVIFLTGDLSQDETIDSYELVARELRHFNGKIFWIPGNHDSIPNMNKVFDKEKNFFRARTFYTPFWDFIFLNTKLDGKDSGFFSEEDLSFLKNQISLNRKNPIALVMHHHPIKTKTPLIDNYIIENKEEIFEIIENSKVRLIMCGHVHNDYLIYYGDIAIETSPATCFQFKKGVTKFEIEHRIGYKIYNFSSTDYVAKAKIWQNQKPGE